MSKSKLKPTHPGIILLEEFLKPMGITQYRLAKDIGVPQVRISKIVKGERAISSDTALRLACYFSMTAEFWMNAQAGYDLRLARQQSGKQIEKTVRPYDAAA
ncbi:MAG: HigA family addiction module antitoxin [Coxiellaceae bacterium]|nr:HigA family addiction module antitoxin [Coxiellaceae bacterium]